MFLSCFFCKQKTAYEMRISDWSSDVCSSDLLAAGQRRALRDRTRFEIDDILVAPGDMLALVHDVEADRQAFGRKLAVDVAVGAIEHHLTFVQGAPLDESEVQRLAQGAVNRFGEIGRAHV